MGYVQARAKESFGVSMAFQAGRAPPRQLLVPVSMIVSGPRALQPAKRHLAGLRSGLWRALKCSMFAQPPLPRLEGVAGVGIPANGKSFGGASPRAMAAVSTNSFRIQTDAARFHDDCRVEA